MNLPQDIASCHRLISQQQEQIQQLQAQVALLAVTVEELTAQLQQNSQNSHRPPSSEGLRKPAALPKKKKGQHGGQPGHPGKTLDFGARADEIKRLAADQCRCGRPLCDVEQQVIERRQVFDLPPPRLHISEYQRLGCYCPACGVFNTGQFPEAVSARVQYGAGVRALLSLLSVGCSLSHQKISRLFADLFRYRVNAGTIVSANRACAACLAESHRVIETALLESRVNHFDETGLRVAGRLHWLHSCSNADYTDLYVHPRRGRAALEEGLLPDFTGWAVHDCWASYFGFDQCRHATCGAHLLRELAGLEEQGRAWARHFRR